MPDTSKKGYVDADGHVRDSEQQYRKYIESPYHNRVRFSSGLDSFDAIRSFALFERLQQEGVMPPGVK